MDVTVRLPSLFPDEVIKVTREGLDSQVPVGSEGLMVGFADGDHVFVRCQRVAPVELLDAVGRLLLQGSFDFLRNDAAAEHAGESVADSGLKLAFESLGDTHCDPLSGLRVS
ncbi:hypothetical protein JOE26_001459 [Rhodococcus coprophilus]|nr:hypothetical protein [Rhodococcus coprophilus]